MANLAGKPGGTKGNITSQKHRPKCQRSIQAGDVISIWDTLTSGSGSGQERGQVRSGVRPTHLTKRIYFVKCVGLTPLLT